ncbi:PepSY domain-containing protein [bacterium]|nr:PepSY domain-containing protein [bacterium]
MATPANDAILPALDEPVINSTDGTGRGSPPIRRGESRRESTHPSFYRMVWRWHFYAGLLVTPVLMIMATTGALYIFKTELEVLIHPYMGVSKVGDAIVPYQTQLDTATAFLPKDYQLLRLTVPYDSYHTTRFTFIATSPEATRRVREVFIDPYTGNVTGEMGPLDFFNIILVIHRQLFIGTTGRILTELSMCWSIILLITGTYLWWPKKRNQVWGTWLPRWWGKQYVVLRDLHSIFGLIFMPVALVIALTGLMYTFVWGNGYNWVANATNTYAVFRTEVPSKSPANLPTIPIDTIIRSARERCTEGNIFITVPRSPEQSYVCFFGGTDRPTSLTRIAFDRATGEELMSWPVHQMPILYRIGQWNFTLHVGSILSMPSKVVWFLACMMLNLLPITGIWMWWIRRPKGKTGFPRRSDAHFSRGVVLIILALSILMPVVGISILAILIVDWIIQRLTCRQVA